MIGDRDLIARFGSPLYVYDLARVRAALDDLRAALPRGAKVLFSLKANPHPDLARVLRLGGCHGELSSVGELATALAAGFSPADCLYTGPGKTAEEIGEAVALGVRRFSVESDRDLRRVGAVAAAAGVVAHCLLRVNGARAAGGAGMRMTGVASQFGFDIETLPYNGDPDVPGTRVVGFHFFPLTNAQDEETLCAELEGSVRAAALLQKERGLPVDVLDIGGGFSAPYARAGERPVYRTLRPRLEAALDEHFPDWREGAPQVYFESGRYLVADCGRLLCTVTDVKESRQATYAVLDTGIHHLGGMSGLGRLLPLSAVPHTVDGGDERDDAGGPRDGEPGAVTLAGPLCTPADVLSRSVEVTDLRPGAPLVIPNVGAYGLTASLLGFLSRPAAREVVLDGDHVASVSRLTLQRTEEKETTAVDTQAVDTQAVDTQTDGAWDEVYEGVLRAALPRLPREGRLEADTDLIAAGLDSLAMVELVVRLEQAFAVSLPDETLTAAAFATPGSLWDVVESGRQS
ncbi:phosphopantetheine-binding protein [Microbispora sp. NPDC049125]|uniref:phosphopantetheine-binding protein n=1 Tax=Microbispora sp. NPDC049125 TaxID=3154929 RepID=UPI00346787E8